MTLQNTLNALPVKFVGDGKRPNTFFVSDPNGKVVMITTDFAAAHRYWLDHARYGGPSGRRYTLEDRLTGVLGSVEPDERGILRVYDNSHFITGDK